MRKIIGFLCVALILGFAFNANVKADDAWSYTVTGTITNWWSGEGENKVNKPDSEWSWLSWDYGGIKQVNDPSYDSSLRWGSWGLDGKWKEDPSGFSVTGSQGAINFDDSYNTVIENAVKLTHINKTISGSVTTPTMIDFVLDFAISMGETFKKTLQLEMSVGFWETPNSGKESPGFEQDMFYFFTADAISQLYTEFEFGDGQKAYLTFSSSFTALDPESLYYKAAAEKLGTTDGEMILGWITNEKATNNMFIHLGIQTTEPTIEDIILDDTEEETPSTSTPEPATLLILGLGTLGAGYYGRRRIKK